MHPVADKIKMNAFEGEIDILGKSRDVSFFGTNDHKEEKTSLVIMGLTMSEAWDVLSRLHGPAIVADANKTSGGQPSTTNGANGASKAATTAVAKVEQKKEAPKPPIDVKSVEVKKEPEPEADDLDDLGDEGGASDLDMDFLMKQDKLRVVIEHMIEKGFKTEKEVLDQCMKLRAELPTLKALDAKGQFEKRVERSAGIVINGDAASA